MALIFEVDIEKITKIFSERLSRYHVRDSEAVELRLTYFAIINNIAKYCFNSIEYREKFKNDCMNKLAEKTKYLND